VMVMTSRPEFNSGHYKGGCGCAIFLLVPFWPRLRYDVPSHLGLSLLRWWCHRVSNVMEVSQSIQVPELNYVCGTKLEGIVVEYVSKGLYLTSLERFYTTASHDQRSVMMR